MTELDVAGQPAQNDGVYHEMLAALMKRLIRLNGIPTAVSLARRVPQLKVDGHGDVLDFDRADPLSTVSALLDLVGSAFDDTITFLSDQAAPVSGDNEPRSSLHSEFSPQAAPGPSLRILLIDDHSLFREGMAGLINSQPDMTIVGQAGSVHQALILARKLKPDVVLMDITLPDGTGLEAARAVRSELPDIQIIFLTVHEDDDHLFAAFSAGAVGYLPKNVHSAELVNRLRDVARGDVALTPLIARRILGRLAHSSIIAAPGQRDHESALTDREIEIMRELTNGTRNREIAQRLLISEHTVRNHVSNILAKLQLHSRRDVARYIRERNLPHPPDTPAV